MTKLSTQEAADYLGVSASTLSSWRYSKKDLIPHYNLGSKIYYTEEDLKHYLSQCRRDGSTTAR